MYGGMLLNMKLLGQRDPTTQPDHQRRPAHGGAGYEDGGGRRSVTKCRSARLPCR